MNNEQSPDESTRKPAGVRALEAVLAGVRTFEVPRNVRLIISDGYISRFTWLWTLTEPSIIGDAEALLTELKSLIHPEVLLWRFDAGLFRSVSLDELAEAKDESERVGRRRDDIRRDGTFGAYAEAGRMAAREVLRARWVQSTPADLFKARGIQDVVALWVHHIYIATAGVRALAPKSSGARKVVVCEQGVSLLNGTFLGARCYELGVEKPPEAGVRIGKKGPIRPLQTTDPASDTVERGVVFFLGPPKDAAARALFDEYQTVEEEPSRWQEYEDGAIAEISERKQGRPSLLERLFSPLVGAQLRITPPRTQGGGLRRYRVRTLQILPHSVREENGRPAPWPPEEHFCRRAAQFLAGMLNREWVDFWIVRPPVEQ